MTIAYHLAHTIAIRNKLLKQRQGLGLEVKTDEHSRTAD